MVKSWEFSTFSRFMKSAKKDKKGQPFDHPYLYILIFNR